MFSAFHKLWMKNINFSIKQLSSGIKDIVKEYGDPPKDDRSMLLNMMVGILTSGPVGKEERLSEDVCRNKLPGCIWHDDKCVCFGKSTIRYPGKNRQYDPLSRSEIEEMKKIVDDYEAALINNYECDNGKPSIPSSKDFNIKNPIQYPKCFIPLHKLTEDEPFHCNIPQDLW